MNRDKLDRWLEMGILGLVIAILVYGPLAMGAVGSFHFAVIESLTVGIILLWVIRIWAGTNPRLLWTPVCWTAIAFGIYAAARYFTADIEYVARQEVLRVLVYTVVFLAIQNNLYGNENLRTIALALVFLAMMVAGYALYQYFTDSDRVWTYFKPYRDRASGTYISPNHLGGFLEMVLPLGLALTLLGRYKPLTKVFIGYAALVVMAGIAVTFSRGAWAAALAGLLVFFAVLLFRRSHRIPAMILLALILIGSAVLIPRDLMFRQRLQQVATNEKKIYTGLRFEIWHSALQMWRENALWGVGPAHFDYRFRSFRPAGVQQRPDRVHNDYINTLADWGIVGFGIIATAMGLIFWGALRTWRRVGSKFSDLGEQSNSTKASLVLGSAAGLVAILAHSLVDFNMHIPANALTAITLMAILSTHLRFATDDFWTKKHILLRAVTSLVLLACAAVLSTQVPMHVQQDRYLKLAAKAPVFSDKQAQLLESAFQTDSRNPEVAYAIGEAYRVQSQEGGVDYKEKGEKALVWYTRTADLNPWDGYAYLRKSLMLDWLDRGAEAEPLMRRAEALDPNGYFTVAHIGLHYVNRGDYAAARSWFERSTRLLWEKNPIAHNYLSICDQKLEEAAKEANLRLQVTTP